MTQITLSQVAALWKAEKRKYVRKASYAHYVQHLNKHILPALGGRGAISGEDVQAYADGLLGKGLAPKTVKDSILILKMIHRHGERLGLWQHLDFRVHFPSGAMAPRRLPVLALDRQQRLVRHLQENFSFRNLGLLICLYSGLRIGEICALQWKDIDAGAGEIRVCKTVSRVWLSDGGEREYSLSIGAPKTAASVRDIPISRPLAAVLRPLRKVVNPDYFVVSNAPVPLEPRYYRDYFARLLGRLDIPPVRFHALRHSFATRCIESRCDYKAVSAILGHASIATTLDLYVHPGHEAKKKAIERMAKFLG